MGVRKQAIGGIHHKEIERKAAHFSAPVISAPRGVDRLTDLACKSARANGSIRKLADGKGLYLAVMPNGTKLWRLKYRYAGKERVYSIGPFPEVGLAEARTEREAARKWLRDGKDPVTQRRVTKASAAAQRAITFALVSEEWLARQHYSAGHRTAQRTRLDRELLPYLGNLPLSEITPAVALDTLRRIERRGALETAAKCRQIGSQICRYAIQTARADTDSFAALRGAIASPKRQVRATIPLTEMPHLFEALHAVPAEINTKLAVYWLILTAVRTGEMRFATWGEIEGRKLWRIPAERMKMDREHVVPLSKQAQQVLALARPLRQSDDAGALLFPGFTRHGALSENAVLALLARAGYFGRQTGHGFRASFSTWAHEVHEADPDVIEACLAHVKGGVRGIYNRAAYLSKRAVLLQAWAEQCAAWGMKL